MKLRLYGAIGFYALVGVLTVIGALLYEAKAASAAADGYHCWSLDGCPARRSYRRHHPKRPVVIERYYREPEDMAPAWAGMEDRRGKCLTDRRGEPVNVEVVSTEHNSEDAARESAKKLWMVQTAWKYGGQYIDLDNAANVREKCGPSNPMDTITGRLIEGAQKLTGNDGQNMRCEISARPCSPPLQPMERHR